ncbi:hypothetical protein AB7M35_001753 [Amorphus suaedae]
MATVVADPAGSTVPAYVAGEMPNLESSRSGISWGAIIGGAVGALSVSLVLSSLAGGLGFASVSAWPDSGASLAGIGVGAVIALVVVQWLAAAFGGYLTGRLRTKWAAMHSDEVFFRDTAHGFLAWALATLIVLGGLMTAAGTGVGAAAVVGSGAAQGASAAAVGQSMDGSDGYLVDTLFRTDPNATAATEPATPAEARGEAGRILARGVSDDLSPADRTYLASIVSRRTGLSQADAEARVDQVIVSARETAEEARQAASVGSFALAISLAIGAFVAAAAGALGGRHRDEL